MLCQVHVTATNVNVRVESVESTSENGSLNVTLAVSKGGLDEMKASPMMKRIATGVLTTIIKQALDDSSETNLYEL